MKLFVDSGAFSAWQIGKRSINLHHYCNFIMQNREQITCYANLDVIAPNDPEYAAKAGFENLLYMRSKGLDPIPVFHVRESMDWLKRMLDLGCQYIGLSATSIDSKVAVDDWYELAWSMLVDRQGAPLVKVHAFGEGRPAIMARYPWHSADSSTWLNSQRYGLFFHSSGRRLKHTTKTYVESRISPDIGSLDVVENAAFEIDLDKLNIDKSVFEDRKSREAWIARALLTAGWFHELENKIRDRLPIRHPSQGLITGANQPKIRPTDFPDEFNLYLAAVPNYSILPCLNYVKHECILASYYYLRPNHMRQFREYKNNPEAVLSVKPFLRHSTLLNNVTKSRTKSCNVVNSETFSLLSV